MCAARHPKTRNTKVFDVFDDLPCESARRQLGIPTYPVVPFFTLRAPLHWEDPAPRVQVIIVRSPLVWQWHYYFDNPSPGSQGLAQVAGDLVW